LPFSAESFDVVLLYEAIYYLRRPEEFLQECQRVLRRGGVVLISTVNREWPEFNPSPYSARYFAGEELEQLLEEAGFRVELYGAFPVERKSLRGAAVSSLKRAAVALHLLPRTMKGKELLKRLFFGRLVSVPGDVEESGGGVGAGGELEWPGRIGSGSGNRSGTRLSGLKVLYAVGRLE
jgi:SAM-dependent methyltransferase